MRFKEFVKYIKLTPVFIRMITVVSTSPCLVKCCTCISQSNTTIEPPCMNNLIIFFLLNISLLCLEDQEHVNVFMKYKNKYKESVFCKVNK